MSRRLFVALDAPDACRELATGARAVLDEGFPELRVRWQPEANLHLTLSFLGSVPDEHVEACLEHVRRCAARAVRFKLSTTRLGAFPSPRRPSVIWMGIEASPASALAGLQRDVADAFRQLREERRPFRPHLTLGRVKTLEGVDRGALASALARLPNGDAEWEPDRVVMVESRLTSDGAVHTEVGAGTIPA